MARQVFLQSLLLFASLVGVLPDSPPSLAEFGFCASSSLMEDFNFTAYEGQWYTVMSIPNTFSTIRQCDIMTVQLTQNGSFSVGSGGLDEEEQPLMQRATLERGDTLQGETYLMLNSSDAPAVSYDIVSTDYYNYSCVYSCFSISALKVELFWILTKDLNSTEAAKQHCLQVFEEMELDTDKLSYVPQEEDLCRAVKVSEQTEPATKNSSPSEASGRSGRIEGMVLEDGSPVDEEGSPAGHLAGKAPTAALQLDTNISNLKIESRIRKEFPHVLNEEEMDDAEYFVLDEDYVEFNTAQTATASLSTTLLAGLLLACRGIIRH